MCIYSVPRGAPCQCIYSMLGQHQVTNVYILYARSPVNIHQVTNVYILCAERSAPGHQHHVYILYAEVSTMSPMCIYSVPRGSARSPGHQCIYTLCREAVRGQQCTTFFALLHYYIKVGAQLNYISY